MKISKGAAKAIMDAVEKSLEQYMQLSGMHDMHQEAADLVEAQGWLEQILPLHEED